MTLTTLQEKMRSELDEGFWMFFDYIGGQWKKSFHNFLSQAISTAYKQGQESVLNEMKHTAIEIFDEGAGIDMAIILADKLKELLIHTK